MSRRRFAPASASALDPATAMIRNCPRRSCSDRCITYHQECGGRRVPHDAAPHFGWQHTWQGAGAAPNAAVAAKAAFKSSQQRDSLRKGVVMRGPPVGALRNGRTVSNDTRLYPSGQAMA